MCNCNQKRANYTSGTIQPQNGMVKVKRVTNNPITLYGDITGRMYVFRNINDINWVDERDISGLGGVSGLQVLPGA